MDTQKFSIDEIRSYGDARLKEVEGEIRSDFVDLRMDIYQAPAANLSRKRALRKNLARLLTVKSEKQRQSKTADKSAGDKK